MLLKKISTIQRVLFCLAVSNIGLLLFLLGFTYRFELNETDFIVMSMFAGTVNFFWVWALLRKSFNTVENVAEHLKKIVDVHADDKLIDVETTGKYKIHVEGHQKEVADLVHAFNQLVDDINKKAKKSNKIIKDVEIQNGD